MILKINFLHMKMIHLIQTCIKSNNDVFHVTALNIKKTLLFIPYDSQAEGKIISPEIIVDNALLQSYRLVDRIESKTVKFDIHNSFKYLNRFLDIAPVEPPINEYLVSTACYEYTQKILEIFPDIIINLSYKADSTSNGEINANLTAQKLNIDFESPIESQVKEIGEIVYNLFRDYDNKKPKIDRKRIENDIVDLIKDLIYYDIDEDDNLIPEHKNECLHKIHGSEFPNENYDWKSRIDEYGIEEILQEMKKLNELHKERSSPSESADKIKEKLWKDFLSKKSCIKNRKKFVEE